MARDEVNNSNSAWIFLLFFAIVLTLSAFLYTLNFTTHSLNGRVIEMEQCAKSASELCSYVSFEECVALAKDPSDCKICGDYCTKLGAWKANVMPSPTPDEIAQAQKETETVKLIAIEAQEKTKEFISRTPNELTPEQIANFKSIILGQLARAQQSKKQVTDKARVYAAEKEIQDNYNSVNENTQRIVVALEKVSSIEEATKQDITATIVAAQNKLNIGRIAIEDDIKKADLAQIEYQQSYEKRANSNQVTTSLPIAQTEKITIPLSPSENDCSPSVSAVVFTTAPPSSQTGTNYNSEECPLLSPEQAPVLLNPNTESSSKGYYAFASGSGSRGITAFIIHAPTYSDTPTIQLLSSPSFLTMEEKVNQLLGIVANGKERDNSLNDCSNKKLDEGEEFVDCGGKCIACIDNTSPKKVPLFLWGALIVILLPFIFMSKFFKLDNDLQELDKKEFSFSVFQKELYEYQKLILKTKFQKGVFETQEILLNFAKIRRKLISQKIKHSLQFNKNQFPRILLNDNLSPISQFQRTESLLHEGIYSIEHGDYNGASLLLEVISSSYNSLTKNEREKLAQLYESFIYRINGKN